MNVPVMEFFIENVDEKEVRQRRILEVGSKYVNGSVRPFINRFHPKEYLGVDAEPGKFVDLTLPAERLVERFGEKSFDMVISTELLEHVKDWRIVVNNMKGVLKENGCIYITTRSRGFPYHAYPFDFWRYETDNMKQIFSDFRILALERDHEAPGVFLKAMKPEHYQQVDLSNMTLWSVILGKRTVFIPDVSHMPAMRRLGLLLSQTASRLKIFLKNLPSPVT